MFNQSNKSHHVTSHVLFKILCITLIIPDYFLFIFGLFDLLLSGSPRPKIVPDTGFSQKIFVE